MNSIKSNDVVGFTLIELLIVVAILGILAAAVVIVLNPVQLLAESRDAQRLSDIDSISKTLTLYQANNNGTLPGLANTLYISLSDSSSTCGDLNMPGLPSGWSYQCSNTPKSVNGSGWIPANFGSDAANTISSLPVDPVNTLSSGFYYAYVVSGNQYELTAIMESTKFRGQEISAPPVSNYPGVFAEGSSLSISPLFNPSGLVGYWKFDEGSGSTANDSSGSGYTGTIADGPIWTGGKINDALQFSAASDQYVQVSNGAIVKNLPASSISAWIQMPSQVGALTQTVYSENEPAGVDFGLLVDNANCGTGLVQYYMYNGSDHNACSTSRVDDGGWHFLVGTYASGTTMKLYVDGNLVGSATGSPNSSATASYIGRSNQGLYFNGTIDDVRVYNRTLSPAEITAMYDSEK